MAVWTLTYDGTTQTFAQWGLKGLQRSQVSQSTGSVTFQQSGAAYDGTPLFAIDEVVTISKDGVPWHVGPVIMVPREGGAKSESLVYEIADPWWYLEQLTYSQSIVTGAGDTQTTRISLFGGIVAGVSVKLSVQNVITSAVGLVTAAGAEITVAFSGSFGVSPPMADMRDPTCAEIIRAALRWTPDATAGWYYGTEIGDVPELRIATRAGAVARSIDLSDQARVNLISIRPREDLRRDRVMIYYEITSTDGEETYTALQLDDAGSGSPFRTLKATLPLSGPQTQRQLQWLETEAVSVNSTTWWKRYVPALQNAVDLSISGGAKEPEEDGSGDFSRAIIDGQVPGWLDDPEAPISGNMRVSAKLSYKITKEDGSEVVFKDDPASVVIGCTDLTTGFYSRVTSYAEGEPVPSGVAAALLAALGVLQYDGSIKIKARECVFIARPGDVLNLTGSDQTAWATARMQVQKVDEDADAGQTVITFGPPKHLSPQDIVEMLRTLRGKPPVHNLSERATGKAGEGNKTQGGKGTANDNGSSASAAWNKVVAKKDGRTMTLDAENGIKLEKVDGSFIDHQTNNNRTLYQDATGKTCEVKTTKIELLDASGNGVTLQPSGLVFSSAGISATLNASGLSLTDGTKTSSYTLNQLLHNDGAGKTMNVNEEQVVINDSTRMMVIAPAETTMQDGSDNFLSLKATEVRITDGGGNYSSATTEGGFLNKYDGQDAQLYIGTLKLKQDASSIVEIYPVTGKNIQLRETASCVDEGGVPTPKKAHYLRSLPVSV